MKEIEKFLEWCFDYQTPFWVTGVAFIVSGIAILLYAFVALVCFALGYWITFAGMVFVVPILVLYRRYRADMERNK
jgi:Flp pilus assembly protein TadB